MHLQEPGNFYHRLLFLVDEMTSMRDLLGRQGRGETKPHVSGLCHDSAGASALHDQRPLELGHAGDAAGCWSRFPHRDLQWRTPPHESAQKQRGTSRPFSWCINDGFQIIESSMAQEMNEGIMAKGRSTIAQQRATQQRIAAGYNIVTSSSAIGEPSKAELRASIPAYDESMVKKIPEKASRKTKK